MLPGREASVVGKSPRAQGGSWELAGILTTEAPTLATVHRVGLTRDRATEGLPWGSSGQNIQEQRKQPLPLGPWVSKAVSPELCRGRTLVACRDGQEKDRESQAGPFAGVQPTSFFPSWAFQVEIISSVWRRFRNNKDNSCLPVTPSTQNHRPLTCCPVTSRPSAHPYLCSSSATRPPSASQLIHLSSIIHHPSLCLAETHRQARERKWGRSCSIVGGRSCSIAGGRSCGIVGGTLGFLWLILNYK